MLRITRHSIYVYVRLGTISSFSVKLCNDVARMMIIYVSVRSQILLTAEEPTAHDSGCSAFLLTQRISISTSTCLVAFARDACERPTE